MAHHCTKVFAEIPFAHRQHKHEGHCAFVHGHNWNIEVTFVADALDEIGFVLDFGKLRFLKEWIDEKLDHALLISRDDPELDLFYEMHKNRIVKLTVVENGSAEGLAQWLYFEFKQMVFQETAARVSVSTVTVREDSRNSATV